MDKTARDAQCREPTRKTMQRWRAGYQETGKSGSVGGTSKPELETTEGAGCLPNAIRSLMEDEEHLLTFYAFPPVMHRSIRSTNAIESFFSNVRQRTDQIDAFPTETSCLTIVWAVMQDIRLPKIPVG